MKKKIQLSIAILLIALNASAQQPEGNSVKGQINLNVFAQTPTLYLKHGDFHHTNYNLDASYGLSKHFDLGIYYSYNHISQDKYQELIGSPDYSYIHGYGVVSRYYLMSYLINRPVKFDFYLKGLLGGQYRIRYMDVYNKTTKDNVFDYGILLGAKYMPLKYLGIMAEFGYVNSQLSVNLGLSFRIK